MNSRSLLIACAVLSVTLADARDSAMAGEPAAVDPLTMPPDLADQLRAAAILEKCANDSAEIAAMKFGAALAIGASGAPESVKERISEEIELVQLEVKAEYDCKNWKADVGRLRAQIAERSQEADRKRLEELRAKRSGSPKLE